METKDIGPYLESRREVCRTDMNIAISKAVDEFERDTGLRVSGIEVQTLTYASETVINISNIEISLPDDTK